MLEGVPGDQSVVRWGRLSKLRETTRSLPVEASGIDNDPTDGRAVTSDPLYGR
jgi:hypothetical protein